MKYLISFILLISFSAFGSDETDPPNNGVPNVSDLVMPLYESTQAVDDSKLNCEMVNGERKCYIEAEILHQTSFVSWSSLYR
jgi:hypothetical protein